MNSVNSKLNSIRRLAAKNELEVDDLLELAVIGDSSAVPVIQELRREHQWPRSNVVEGSNVVPLARWAEVVCTYLNGGCDALLAYALQKEKDSIEFAVAVLEHLKTPEAVRTILRLVSVSDSEKSTIERLSDGLILADAINGMFFFKRPLPIDPADAQGLRVFLHALLAMASTQPERVRVVCALRGVGNAESIRLISGLPHFDEPWKGLDKRVCHVIRKRESSAK